MNKFYNIQHETENKIIKLIGDNNISIVDGGLLSEFEYKAANLLGHNLGVATCNGTAAIHLAYFAIDIKKNDEVLMPTYGFHAMASPLLQLGGIPIFCDIEKETLTIDLFDIKRKITSKTKAIMVLQPWGNVANIDLIVKIAIENNLILISDSSHAPGAKWNNRPLGNYFDIICASFGKGKLITGGELGVFTTNNEIFRDRALLYSHTNRVPKAFHTNNYSDLSNIVGIKYRPHPMALQLAIDQIESFHKRNQELISNVNKLLDAIAEIDSITIPQTFEAAKRDYWKIILLTSEKLIERIFEMTRNANIKFEDNHYKLLMHKDTIITKYYKLHQVGFPIANYLKSKIFQIDAIQLYDQYVLSNYIGFFKHLK